MIVKVYNYENNEELVEFKVRKNTKSVIDKIEKNIMDKYNCSIKNVLVTGKVDYMNPENTDLHYVLFGYDLPCRLIKYECMVV